MPENVVPVDRSNDPVLSCTEAFRVMTTIAPDDDDTPAPLSTNTEPPTAELSVVVPAEIVTEPPVA